MKVLLLNGSCKANGSTYTALSQVANVLEEKGISTEIFQIGAAPLRDCIGCGQCAGKYKCVFDDDLVNAFIEKAKDADGFVFGSPVYYAHADGRVLCFLDRAFYAGKRYFAHKPAAVVAVARRAGTTAAIDTLNKYPTIAEMPLVSSSYWNMAFGSNPSDILKDEEGLQTMRNLGENMAWVLRCIEAGKNAGIVAPDTSSKVRTNFIRS
ncbi:MAG: flavodoxin family protein [Bacteroides sp.]|nr:flavodoxin family protein [Bacillota bacterium]MCM1455114.1 flavodoxin family protein [Bacteroides sp.]